MVGSGGSRMWLPHGGRAVGFALILTLAVEHAAKCGCSAGPLHCCRRLQVHQVIVRLAHPRVLALVTPPEEELGTLLKEAACSGEQKVFIVMRTACNDYFHCSIGLLIIF